jgi:hypothetical protein
LALAESICKGDSGTAVPVQNGLSDQEIQEICTAADNLGVKGLAADNRVNAIVAVMTSINSKTRIEGQDGKVYKYMLDHGCAASNIWNNRGFANSLARENAIKSCFGCRSVLRNDTLDICFYNASDVAAFGSRGSGARSELMDTGRYPSDLPSKCSGQYSDFIGNGFNWNVFAALQECYCKGNMGGGSSAPASVAGNGCYPKPERTSDKGSVHCKAIYDWIAQPGKSLQTCLAPSKGEAEDICWKVDDRIVGFYMEHDWCHKCIYPYGSTDGKPGKKNSTAGLGGIAAIMRLRYENGDMFVVDHLRDALELDYAR